MHKSVLLAFLLAACASSSTPPVSSAPEPLPSPIGRVGPPVPPTATFTTPPDDWQLLDAATDGVQGTGVRRAERELLQGRRPARTVVVAVIDGGIDTAHADLRAQLWSNPKEVAANGKDDDGDGLVDDTFGWNYLGGADGRSVHVDTIELTREYRRCHRGGTATAPECAGIDSAYAAKSEEAKQEAAQLEQVASVYDQVTTILRKALPGDTLSVARVTALSSPNDTVTAARDLYLRLAAAGVTESELKEAVTDAQNTLKFGLNPEYDPRSTIVRDDESNVAQRTYGNRDVTGPDASHGTHVAGIIGAVRGNAGMDGIAVNVKLMSVRAVPDGDEHDKDVANAIRYAVDHGAQVINMSFGKGYSPQKQAVDDAVKYADQHGVLMIHASGNDGEDLSRAKNFPSPVYIDGGRAANWIEVGASSWKGGDQLAASFSNYGKAEVDLFAPGVDILSTIPGGGWDRKSGTSMASPVVTGVAAMLLSYFPKLTGSEVKRILLQSAARYPEQMVARPGAPDGSKVRFGDLSATGGVVDAYAAVRTALAMERSTP